MFRKQNHSPISKPVIYIYPSEYQAIVSETKKFPQLETGGDLFGTFTHGEMPIIWLALGPGPKAQQNIAEFCQDTVFTTQWQQFLMKNFGIQYIGTWHSHHKLGIIRPSYGDVHAAQIYARRHNRRKTLEIIVTLENSKSEPFLYPYFYSDAVTGEYSEANFDYLENLSPLRLQLNREINAPIHIPFNYREKLIQAEDLMHITVPEILQSALKYFSSDEYYIDFRNDVFMVIISISDRKKLFIALKASENIEVLQVNITDEVVQKTFNITDSIHDEIQSSKDDGLLLNIVLVVRNIEGIM